MLSVRTMYRTGTRAAERAAAAVLGCTGRLRAALSVLVVTGGVLVSLGTGAADAACSPVAGSPGVATVFTYTGAEQCYSVPAGTVSVEVAATGAPGVAGETGGSGGAGATVSAYVPLAPGTTMLYVEVGGPAVGDGGLGGPSTADAAGGAGGGASDVRTVPVSALSGSLASRLLVAGGGGGGGGATGGGVGLDPGAGGAGGFNGASGIAADPGEAGDPGAGGTQTGGGSAGISAVKVLNWLAASARMYPGLSSPTLSGSGRFC